MYPSATSMANQRTGLDPFSMVGSVVGQAAAQAGVLRSKREMHVSCWATGETRPLRNHQGQQWIRSQFDDELFDVVETDLYAPSVSISQPVHVPDDVSRNPDLF